MCVCVWGGLTAFGPSSQGVLMGRPGWWWKQMEPRSNCTNLQKGLESPVYSSLPGMLFLILFSLLQSVTRSLFTVTSS